MKFFDNKATCQFVLSVCLTVIYNNEPTNVDNHWNYWKLSFFSKLSLYRQWKLNKMKLFWWEKASAQTLKSAKRTKFIYQKKMNQKVVKLILLLLIFIFLNMKWWFCINWLIKNYSSSPNGLWVNGRMGYWLRRHEDKRNNFFSKIQVVGKKYREKNNFSHQNAIQPPLCWFSKPVLFATRRL